MDSKCQIMYAVYDCCVTSLEPQKIYFGVAERKWKKGIITIKVIQPQTTFSSYVWHLEETLDVTPNLKWSVVRCTTPYSNVSKKCLLCHLQGLGITIKSLYVITYMYQIFGVCDVCQQIPKSIYQASNLFPNDFSNNFS